MIRFVFLISVEELGRLQKTKDMMVGYVSKGGAKINRLMLNIIIKGTFILKGGMISFITKLKNSLKGKKLLTVILYH